MIWLEGLIILACIMIGARKNGVAMGFAGGIGLILLVFVFGLRPSSPPINAGLTHTKNVTNHKFFLYRPANKAIVCSGAESIAFMAGFDTEAFPVVFSSAI